MKSKMTILACAFLITLLAVGTAFAFPGLQLDIEGGTYFEGTEQSTLTEDQNFTLYALLDPSNKATLDQLYAITASIYPKMAEESPDPDFGSVEINGDDYYFETYGTPPITTDLPGHSAFETYYSQITAFMFTTTQELSTYNVQDDPDIDPSEQMGGTGTYYMAFNVDTTNLAEGYLIHFDLFDINDGSIFAPFSKDAGTRVPEPGTLVLLGIGMLGVGVYRRKMS